MVRTLLLKLPYCPHPASTKPADFRAQSSFRPIPSLALAALAGYTGKYAPGIDVQAIDLNIEAYREPGEPIDETLYPGLLEAAIRDENYDILGLSAMFVFNEKWVEDAVRLSRRHHPGSHVVLGGGYPTMFRDRAMSKLDGVWPVSGEGDDAIINCFRNNNPQPRQRLDMAALPVPAWHKLNVERYFRASGDRTLPIEGTRGCPYDCAYCTVKSVWGGGVRCKPVENLVAEVQELVSQYGVETLHFVDDNFTFNRKWAISVLKRLLLVPNRPKLTFSNFSVKHLDPEVVDLLMQHGVRQFNVAIETGSPEMQKRIGKNLDLDKAEEVVERLKALGLHVHLCWMLGFPGETLDQIRQTLSLAEAFRAHSNQFLTVLPYPGTKLYEDAKAAGQLACDDSNLDQFDCRGGEYVKSNEWTYPQLQEMIYDANIRMNFLHNPWLDTPDGREHFREFLGSLVLRLPDHVIAHILLGFLGKPEHYRIAAQKLENQGTWEVFERYLGLDYPALHEFKRAQKSLAEGPVPA